jgi:hypothetical protein
MVTLSVRAVFHHSQEGAVMPGTVAVDTAATFASMICMGVIPREVYGKPGEQERNAAGIPKWTAGIAVSYHADPNGGMTAPSEVLNVTIASADDPGASCPPGTAVTLDQLRCGVSAPEQRTRSDGSTRVSGGRLYWSCTAVKPAQSWSSRKSDAA